MKVHHFNFISTRAILTSILVMAFFAGTDMLIVAIITLVTVNVYLVQQEIIISNRNEAWHVSLAIGLTASFLSSTGATSQHALQSIAKFYLNLPKLQIFAPSGSPGCSIWGIARSSGLPTPILEQLSVSFFALSAVLAVSVFIVIRGFRIQKNLALKIESLKERRSTLMVILFLILCFFAIHHMTVSLDVPGCGGFRSFSPTKLVSIHIKPLLASIATYLVAATCMSFVSNSYGEKINE